MVIFLRIFGVPRFSLGSAVNPVAVLYCVSEDISQAAYRRFASCSEH